MAIATTPKDRDVRVEVLVRLQTALFALGAAIDAAQLVPPEEPNGNLSILGDDLVNNLKHANVLVQQVFNTLNAELGMYVIGTGGLTVRMDR